MIRVPVVSCDGKPLMPTKSLTPKDISGRVMQMLLIQCLKSSPAPVLLDEEKNMDSFAVSYTLRFPINQALENVRVEQLHPLDLGLVT